jgi:hypothetical protein
MVPWENSASSGEAWVLSLVSMNAIYWNAKYAKQYWIPFCYSIGCIYTIAELEHSMRTFLGSARFDNGCHPNRNACSIT